MRDLRNGDITTAAPGDGVLIQTCVSAAAGTCDIDLYRKSHDHSATPAAQSDRPLSGEDLETLGRELDAIRQQVLDSRGERDADYIRNVIDFQRELELGSSAVLLSSLFPTAWLAGTVGLSVAKIVENMEIGHNVMHGQWDWMRDDKIHSTTWEWDNASPSDMWKHTQCADTFPKASRPTRKNRSTAKPAASTPRTEGRRFRLGHRSVRPEVRPSMRSRVDARVPAGQVQRR